MKLLLNFGIWSTFLQFSINYDLENALLLASDTSDKILELFPGISLFHNCGGGSFSGGIADQFEPPRRTRVNLISKNIGGHKIAHSLVW